MVRSAALLFVSVLTSTLHAAVAITAITPSLTSPQPVGTPVTWTITGTDTNTGPLTFQYSVAFGSGAFQVVRDFFPGTISTSTWTGPSFVWDTIVGDGVYRVKVVAKDFQSGETATKTVTFTLKPISTGGSFVVTSTANPLVALASAPACPIGSQVRLTITKVGSTLVGPSNWQPCEAPSTSNIYAAGMLASSAYSINYQTKTGVTVTTGPTPAIFTTGPLPSTINFPIFQINEPATAQADSDQTVLHAFISFGSAATSFLPLATNRNGRILWYYNSYDPTHSSLLTRPLSGGLMYTIQTGYSWSPALQEPGQFLREIDLSGNTQKETNAGVLQQELLAMGATDFGPCGSVPIPAPVGAACMGSIHHEAMRMPNGNTAVIVDIEKIFPPGTQGDTTGLNVDIIGDGFLILDSNFQVQWYFETFQHAGGAPQLDINRGPVLGETCASGQEGCPAVFLAGTSGVTPLAHDWLHDNSLYFDSDNGDFYVSSRHQDWIYKVDYKNGSGSNNILWRMGLGGDFTFNNVNNDPYPWFSHQHEAAYENTTTGLMTLFDNGNTRVSPTPLGLGSGNSRGMALTVDENAMTVTPVLSQDLGYYGFAMGSAQLMGNGNYFFQPGIVSPALSFSLEVLPTAGTVNGNIIYNLQSPSSYRGWLMPNLYSPPTN